MSEESGFPWVLELKIPSVPSVAKLTVEDRVVVGRAQKENGVFPDLDLSPWGAMELGVAVEHVAIYAEDDQLMIVDLGSGKATLLNGERLDPEQPRSLDHGDELQLGVLSLQIHVIASPKYGSVVHRQPGVAIAEEMVRGDGQTILFVEDEPETAKIFKLIMERAGFTTHICREVVSAIRALNTENPSAVILDLMLPDIHGLELCRYVRRDIEQREIPIVVVSAAVTQASISQAMDAGADVFLGKPVSMKELVRVVASLVTWYEAKKPAVQTKRLDGSDTFHSMPADVRRDALVFFVAGYEEPIPIVVPKRITIGRRSGSGTPRPHVDLDRYGAFDAGVSRVHAAIHREADGFYVEDLESSNGTWVNDKKVSPKERLPLSNASELRLGSLHMRVFFFTEDDATILGDGAPS